MNSLRPRVIPCLQVADGELFKTRKFKDAKYLGDPVNAVRVFNDLACDELIVVDIKATVEGREPDFIFIEEFASEAFMPLTFGGGITSVEQIGRLFSIGVEKVVVNSAAQDGRLVSDAAAIFGSQSIVVSMDVRKTLFGQYEIWTHSATCNTHQDPIAFAQRMQGFGAGELFVQSVEYEGTSSGYDISLITQICEAVRIPVIACGGAGSLDDIRELLRRTGASGAAAGTLFTLHGKHRAPLISYPSPQEIASLV
jgi:cyclase